MRDIAVIGVGGVGGFFGAPIAHNAGGDGAGPAQVFFVARGPHLNAIRTNGLTLTTTDGRLTACRPCLATDHIEELPPLDLCLVCVKCFDLDTVLLRLRPCLHEESLVLPLLNGAAIYERVRRRISTGTVFPACVYVSTKIAAPGVVEQIGGQGAFLFGPDPQRPDTDLGPLCAFLEQTGVKALWAEDPYPAIWQKYIFVAAFGLVTAHLNKTLGEVMADDDARALLHRVTSEIVAVAQALDVALPDGIIDDALALAYEYPFDQTTSYHRDVAEGRNENEGDLFGGTILRHADALGIPVPATRSVYEAIERRLHPPR